MDCDKERLEQEQVRTLLSQQWMEDLWRMGTLMGTPFVYSAKGCVLYCGHRGQLADEDSVLMQDTPL